MYNVSRLGIYNVRPQDPSVMINESINLSQLVLYYGARVELWAAQLTPVQKACCPGKDPDNTVI